MKEVKSISVTKEGVFVSHLERPLEPNFFGREATLLSDIYEMEKYQQALKAYIDSLMRVDNKDVLEMLLFHKTEPVSNAVGFNKLHEGTYPAPRGLMMEVK